MTLGFLSLGIGLVGIPVPVIPTTGPILLSAFFFARSSERFHRWLTSHPRFGPAIRDYQAGLGIPMRAKLAALIAIGVTFTLTMLTVVTSVPGRLAMVATAVGILAFIFSRPTKRVTPADVPAAVR